MNKHDPWAAAFLSVFLLSVGGQFYNHQPLKAVITLLVGMVCTALTGGAAFFVYYPAVIADAYLIAARIRRGETIDPWQFF